MNYYNDNEPYVAQWLKNLITSGMLPPGDVDDRPIQEVKPDDVRKYTQCHFFAGIGGWSLALQLAGWPADRPVWTGSCPCQPFSVAGKKQGRKDKRHLWPELHRLVKECSPPTIFGEQVASPDGREWLSGVFGDMETLGYAAAGADMCAAGVGAPHIRQRLFWVANSDGSRCQELCGEKPVGSILTTSECAGFTCVLSDAKGTERIGGVCSWSRRVRPANPCCLGYPNGLGKEAVAEVDVRWPGANPGGGGFWDEAIATWFLDGKVRRLKPGITPVVDGFSGRVGRVRAYGSAIVPQVAAKFIEGFMRI